jgi:hypothetical protein
MDRRLLFPAVAVTAWAQQVSPGAAEAEKALRARAEKFFQLQVDKNFRAAWAFVADDTQDYFFNSGRPDWQGVTVDNVEISADGIHAKVTYRVKRTIPIPGVAGQVFELPGSSTWKLENGDWFWYVDQTDGIETPFGRIKTTPGGSGGRGGPIPGMPNLEAMKDQVSIERTSVALSEGSPVQSVAISNHMRGPITIDVQSKIEGLVVELDQKQVADQQNATITFRAKPGAKPTGIVGIDVQPLGQHFDVSVSSN